GQHRIVAVNGTSNYGVLNNGVESLTLKWPNGSKSQEISWTSTVEGFALMDAGQPNTPWVSAPYPTPEEMNPLPMELMARQVGDVHLTEILPNATNDGATFPDGEWIEIHNTGTTSIDLMGWSIMDGLGNITHFDPGTLVFNSTQGATIIDPDGRRLLQFTSYTQLWDNYNHVFLRDMTGTVVDTADYTTDYGEDMALIRGSNPSDSWTPAAWKTPGQPEPGSMPSATTVRFSELLPDAEGSDSQMWPMGEWIELYNYGTMDVDLAGWKLKAASRSLTLHEFNMPLQDTTVVKGGEAVLIALNGTSSFYLKHTSSDSIGLVDINGAAVDTVSWSDTVEGESLIAPNSTHAGVGPDASNATGNWILSAWATPGEVNPVWAPYSDSTDLAITEVLPYCNDDSIEPTEDWVEVHNTGATPLNISRWSVVNAEGERRFMRLDSLWTEGNQTAKVVLNPDERAVFVMDEYVLTGLGDAFDLLDPDGVSVDSASWTVITDCQTLMPGELEGDDWQHTLWPTPGQGEPNPADFATKDDLRFTRFMPSASTDISSDMEFIEISNQGDKLAVLNGWTMRTTTGSMTSYNATVNDLMIQPGSSVLLANDADAVRVYEDGAVVDVDGALDRNFYFPNSGAALQLLDGTGAEVDTIVYGNGPGSVSGWNGIALAEPLASLDNLIYLRGSGCGDTPDTDTVADWHEQWSRLGGSTFCLNTSISTTASVTPLLGPEHGLTDLLAWIESASTSLHVHMYLLQEVHLVQAMIDAQNRGVEVTVVLDYGDSWWKQYDLDTQRGMATELLSAGVQVSWFGDTGENPYAYIHSKVAVKDNASVWIGSGNW
ncbi:MAG: lamin tail domain-containing protein, partial [Candidatus Thermoplasmatota archaeon]|nr:lamin tail domain-containing protein [Candidatus Thermoplasmatota archaeon]